MTTPKKGPAKKVEVVLRTGPRASRSTALGDDDPRNRREAQKSTRPEVARLLEYDERDQDILQNKLLVNVLVPVTIPSNLLRLVRPEDLIRAIANDSDDFRQFTGEFAQAFNTNFATLLQALQATQQQFAELIIVMQEQELMDGSVSTEVST